MRKEVRGKRGRRESEERFGNELRWMYTTGVRGGGGDERDLGSIPVDTSFK